MCQTEHFLRPPDHLRARCPRGRWYRSRVRCRSYWRRCRRRSFRCPLRCRVECPSHRPLRPVRTCCCPPGTWRAIQFSGQVGRRSSIRAGSTSPYRNLCRFRRWRAARFLIRDHWEFRVQVPCVLLQSRLRWFRLRRREAGALHCRRAGCRLRLRQPLLSFQFRPQFPRAMEVGVRRLDFQRKVPRSGELFRFLR